MLEDTKMTYPSQPGLSIPQNRQIRLASSMEVGPPRGELTLPLSRGQEALWLQVRSQPWSPLYNLLVAVARFRGPLETERVRAVYRTLVARHAALRAVFREVAGVPMQFIQTQPYLDFQEVDCRSDAAGGLARRVADASRHPFKLDTGPLFRVRLFRGAEEETVLLATAHHLVLDGWSVGRLTEETLRLLGNPAAVLAPQVLSYANFIAWQRDWMAGPEAAASLAYWRKRLAQPLPVLDLPLDRPRRRRPGQGAAAIAFTLSRTRLDALRELAGQCHTTLANLLLAAFQVLLARHAGQSDILVGIPVAARPQPEYQEVIGFFSNHLAIRGDLSANPPFRAFVGQVDARVREAQAHQNLAFPDLVQALGLGREAAITPVFQAAFVLHGVRLLGEQSGFFGFGSEHGDLEIAGLRVEPFPLLQQESRFDLTLDLLEGPREISGWFKYNPELFHGASIHRMAGHFSELLAGIVVDPACPIWRLPLLTAPEVTQLAVWNATATPLPGEPLIQRLVEKRAGLHPEAPALIWAGGSMSYGELNERANRLAHYLIKLDFPEGTAIGLCQPALQERIVALLAILKSGGACLPLDPEAPPEQLAHRVETARCAVALCPDSRRGLLQGSRACLLSLELAAESLAAQPSHNPRRTMAPTSTAFLCTGSDDQPVPINHAALYNQVRARIQAFHVGPASHVLLWSDFADPGAVAEIFTALGAGAGLSLASRSALQPGPALWHTLWEGRISHLSLPAPALARMPRQALPILRHLMVTGPGCSGELAAHWQQGRHFFHAYGPAEAAGCATWMECKRVLDGQREPPVGHPLANIQVHILGPDLQPVPVGVSGEIHIAGIGVSGSLAWQGASDRYLESPWGQIYRSGHLGRRLDDGSIELLGTSRPVVTPASAPETTSVVGTSDDRDEVLSRVVHLGGSGTATPVYLVHALHGDIQGFRDLAACLGADQPVYGLRAPGLEEGETPVSSIAELAGLHVRALRRQQPYGPYRLVGWSLGGVIAYEMARRLRQAGAQVAPLLLLDSYPPETLREIAPASPAILLARELAGRSGERLLMDTAAVADQAVALGQVLSQAARLDLLPGAPDAARLLRISRVYLTTLAALRHYQPGHYRGLVVLLRAALSLGKLADNGWSRHCGHHLSIRPVAGDHYSLLQQPQATQLAEVLRNCL